MHQRLPLIVLVAWVALVGVGQWWAASGALEPPTMDVYSYAVKAKSVWAAVTQGPWVNPFDIAPTIRPPGTILMSYPFGFGADFHGYYFRSVFLPVALIALAVWVVTGGAPTARPWLRAAMACAVAGAPTGFQFQYNKMLPAASFFGLTDGFLAGVAAVAMAAAVRSAREKSVEWAVLAALLAAFSFMIKPAGIFVMALVGLAWLVLAAERWNFNLARLRADSPSLAFIVRGLGLAVAIYAVAAWAAFGSGYFSANNIAFGAAALSVMKSEFRFFADVDGAMLTFLIKISLGYAVPALIVCGLLVAVRDRAQRTPAAIALACLVVGVWFWMVETGLEVVRYFLPFAFLAVVVVAPGVIGALSQMKPRFAATLAALVASPALASSLILFIPDASFSWQRALGINVNANVYAAENAQSRALIERLRQEGASDATLYLFDITSPLRNVHAVVEFRALIEATAPRVTLALPRDWQRSNAFRLDEILRADVIGFEVMEDGPVRAAILAQTEVVDFAAEVGLLSAWFSALGADEGLETLSQTHVRLVKVADRAKLERSLEALEQRYRFSDRFRAANPPRRAAPNEISILPMTARDISFSDPLTGAPALAVRALAVNPGNGSIRADVWLEDLADAGERQGWTLFIHALDVQGNVIGNAQMPVVLWPSSDASRSVQRATITFPHRPIGAVRLGFGFFRPAGRPLEFLATDPALGDWDGRRVIVPVPTS